MSRLARSSQRVVKRAGTRAVGTGHAAGFTLVELVVVVAIVGVLAAAVLPLARWGVKRQKEYELQRSLRILRTAIDKYHDMALAGLIESDPKTHGYPPDLDTLVEGAELQAEMPEVVPGVSGDYAASGLGLVGGFSGAGNPGGGGGSAAAAGGSAAGNEDSASTLGQLSTGGPGGRQGGSLTQGRPLSSGLGRGGASPGRERSQAKDDDRGDPPRGPDGKPLRIIFLRRIPLDPFTGKADWGFRCYGEKPGNRLWCGRNIFDVYSKHLARGLNGVPYKEW